MEAMLERSQADGSITVEDADTVREFAAFLREAGPYRPASAEDRNRRRQAMIDHAEFLNIPAELVAKLQAAVEESK